jgi:hypothetical protein
MSLSWFGVKTLFRSRCVGAPRFTDKYFDPTVDRVQIEVSNTPRARVRPSHLMTSMVDGSRHPHPRFSSPLAQEIWILRVEEERSFVNVMRAAAKFDVLDRRRASHCERHNVVELQETTFSAPTF